MTSVVIGNCYSDHNLGSAALNEAAVVAIKAAFPSCEVTLVSAGVQDDFSSRLFRHSLRDHPDVRVVPLPLVPSGYRRGSGLASALRGELALRTGRVGAAGPALEALRNADLAVSRGGVVITDPGASGRLVGKYLTMFPMLAAAAMGVPTASMPTSVIEPVSRAGAWFEQRVLLSLDLVAVRDPMAAEVANRLGARNIKTYTDSVFALPVPTKVETAAARVAFGVETARFAVLTARVLRRGVDDDRKLALQAAAAKALLADGSIDVCLVIRQTGGPNGDLPISQRLAAAIGPQARVCDWDYSHRDLVSLYAGAEVVLTQHLHSFIFSVLANTPGVVMSTGTNKVEGLVKGLGLPSWVMLREVMSDAEVTGTIRRAVGDADSLRGLLTLARQSASQSLIRFRGDLRDTAQRGTM